MIKYIVRKKKVIGTSGYKYYAQIAPVTAMTLDEVTEKISSDSTFTEHDVVAALAALKMQIVRAVRSGSCVRLGFLGSFRPTISALGSDTKEGVTAKLIKKVNVRFTKGRRMRSALARNMVTFGLHTESKSAAEKA